MDAVRNAIRAKKILHMDAFKAMIIKFITDNNDTIVASIENASITDTEISVETDICASLVAFMEGQDGVQLADSLHHSIIHEYGISINIELPLGVKVGISIDLI